MLAKNAIEVNYITKRYTDTVAVDNIAFQVKEGEIRLPRPKRRWKNHDNEAAD